MTNPLTPEELDAIEARANAATAGPWFADDWYGPLADDDDAPLGGDVVGNSGVPLVANVQACAADQAFIAAARTDIPRLVATVRDLWELLAEAGPCGCPCYCPDGGGPFVKPDLADPLVMFFADRYGSGTSYQPIDPHVERPAEPPSGPEGEFI